MTVLLSIVHCILDFSCNVNYYYQLVYYKTFNFTLLKLFYAGKAKGQEKSLLIIIYV